MSESKIHPNVRLGDGANIGEFVVLGQPPRGRAPGEMPTVIGPGAVIRSHTVIYAGNRIGKNFETGHHVLVRESNEIGDNVSVGTGTCVEHSVKIGDNVRIHSHAFIPEHSVLEKDCWIGPHVVLTNAKYPGSKNAKASLKGPVVREGAKVGANCTILPGVVIGRGAVVGAGSTVVRDVPDGKVAVGSPARVIKDVREIGDYA